MSAFKDGSEQTILLLKAATKSVPWAKPEDLSYNEAMELLTISSKQREGTHHWRSYGLFEKPSRVVNAVFVDGSIRQLNVPIKPELARALLTIAGGETIDQGELEKISQPQLNCTKIYALSVFVLLSLLPLYKFITRKHELAAI